MGGLFQLSWKKGGALQELGHPSFLVFYGDLGTIMAPVGVSFKVLMYYNEYSEIQGLLEVESYVILDLVDSIQFRLYS